MKVLLTRAQSHIKSDRRGKRRGRGGQGEARSSLTSEMQNWMS